MTRRFLGTTLLLFLAASLPAVETPFQTGTNDEITSYIDTLVKNNVHDKAVLSAMAKLLLDPDAAVTVRERVAWAMGELDMRSGINDLIKATEDKGLLVRSAAMIALIHMRAQAAYPAILEIAKNDPVLPLRQKAVLGMGLLRTDKAVSDLANLSTDPRAEIRAASALSMAATQSKRNDFSQILKEMKGDPDPYVQVRAQVALDIVQGKRSAVLQHLNSEDIDVRLFAANFFRFQGGQADLKKVKEAYNHEANDNVRIELRAAVKAIEKRIEAAKKEKPSSK